MRELETGRTMAAAVVSAGFTSSFIDRLGASTRQLESFVSKTKTTADETFANLKATREEEQHNVDKLLRQLKTLEHERGVAAECARDGSSSGGVAKQRNELDEKQTALKEEVSRLQAKNQLDQSRLQGEAMRLMRHFPINSLKSLTIACRCTVEGGRVATEGRCATEKKGGSRDGKGLDHPGPDQGFAELQVYRSQLFKGWRRRLHEVCIIRVTEIASRRAPERVPSPVYAQLQIHQN